MTAMKFPSTLPSPDQLELACAHLCGLLRDITVELLALQAELMKAGNAGELTAVVHQTADKLAAANKDWAAMSESIRESWRI
jgi:hypothetical protein